MKKLFFVILFLSFPVLLSARQREGKLEKLEIDKNVTITLPFKATKNDIVLNNTPVSQYVLKLGTTAFIAYKMEFEKSFKNIPLPYDNGSLEEFYIKAATVMSYTSTTKGFHIKENNFIKIGKYTGYSFQVADKTGPVSQDFIFLIGGNIYFISYTDMVHYDAGIATMFLEGISINQNGPSQFEGSPHGERIAYIIIVIILIIVLAAAAVFLVKRSRKRKALSNQQ